MTDLKALSEKLDDAMKAFADENGDGFGNRDNVGARDYRDEGFEIAISAMLCPDPRDRQAVVDNVIDGLDAFGADVVAAAARYRLAELSQ